MGVLIALVAVIVLLNEKARSSYLVYAVLFALIIITAFMTKVESQPTVLSLLYQTPNSKDQKKLSNKDKKLLIFYIVDLVERKESVDMRDLAKDLNISIYDLAEIIKFMSQHKFVTAIYPPMRDFPILRKGDADAVDRIVEIVYSEMSKDSMVKKPKFEEFEREVQLYFQKLRRGAE